jgi:8-oxo-dGTP diphosphatase
VDKPVIEVVAALIFDQDNRILITQRPKNSHLGGYWEFPGGRIEKGEQPQEALVREIQEEVNLEIRVDSLFWRERVSYDARTVDIRFYNCELSPAEQQVVPIEVAGFRWISIAKLNSFRFPEADHKLIEQLMSVPDRI